MNTLLSKTLSILNPLIAIGIIGVFVFYGLYGMAIVNGIADFFKTGNFYAIESAIMNPSWEWGLVGLVVGFINAAFACGFIATILTIRKKLERTDKNLRRLYKIEKNNKNELAELNSILKSIEHKIGAQSSPLSDSLKPEEN